MTIYSVSILRKILLALALSSLSMSASAALISYNDRTTFEAAVVGEITDNLESASGNFQTASIDRGVYSFQADGGFNNIITTGGFGDVDGSQFGRVGLNPGDNLTFTFDALIFAFGADLNAFNDVVQRTTVTAVGSGTVFPPINPVNQQNTFFGVVSDIGFTTLTFSSTRTEGFGIDNITYASVAVPEPSIIALFAWGLFGLGLARRRKA